MLITGYAMTVQLYVDGCTAGFKPDQGALFGKNVHGTVTDFLTLM